MSFFAKLRAGATRRVNLWWAVALAVVLTLPALGGGRVIDDFLHYSMRAEDAPPDVARDPFDMYRIPPAPEHQQAARDAGRLPWYAARGFDDDLEQPDRLWVVWSDDGYVPFQPPPVGEMSQVPAVDVLELLTYQYTPSSLDGAMTSSP